MDPLSRARKFASEASPILQDLVLGYANKPSAYVADVLFPTIDVQDIAFKIPNVGADSMRIVKTERESGAKSNIWRPGKTEFADVMLEEHDLSYSQDYSYEIATKRWRSARKIGIQVNWNVMQLKREYIASVLAQDSSTYKDDYKKVLSGTSKWTNEASDPVKDIQDAVKKITAGDANRLILGAEAFYALQNHPKIKAAMSFNFTGQSNDSIVTEKHLSMIFGIDVVKKTRSRYLKQEDPSQPGTMEYLWDPTIAIIAYANPNARGQANMFESSFGYSFFLENYPVADTWNSEDKKVSYDRITTWMKHAVVDNSCGYLITGCA